MLLAIVQVPSCLAHSIPVWCCPGPVCPAPPGVPLDGQLTVVPAVLPVKETTSCVVAGARVSTVAGPSLLSLTCPSFLSVYITTATYGREKGEDQLCSGEKDRPPAEDCLSTEVVDRLRQQCLGLDNCTLTATEGMVDLGDTCTRQKKELKTNHTCGEDTSILIFLPALSCLQ